MDDLTFRRTIYADPHCTDEEVVRAAQDDPAKMAFWNELKQLDIKMQQASQVDVPNDLCHKLLLRQSLNQAQVDKKQKKWFYALAASVAMVGVLGYSTWIQSRVIDIGDHALAHVQHEGGGYALEENGNFSLQEVNAQLASLGAQLTDNIGRIYYANFCNFENIRSFHMVFEGENGKVTVFVIPDSKQLKMVDEFADENMVGERIQANHASIVLVAAKNQSMEKFKYKLRKKLLFSA